MFTINRKNLFKLVMIFISASSFIDLTATSSMSKPGDCQSLVRKDDVNVRRKCLIALSKRQGKIRIWNHAPNGDFSQAHTDTIINYTTWDGSPWTTKVVGNTFIHAPGSDFSKAHTDTIMNYVAWDGSQWTAKVVGKKIFHAPNGDFSKAHTDTVMNYIAWDTSQWTAELR